MNRLPHADELKPLQPTPGYMRFVKELVPRRVAGTASRGRAGRCVVEGDVGKGRRFPFGLPRSDNANDLWIQLFYSTLLAHHPRASIEMDGGNCGGFQRLICANTTAVNIVLTGSVSLEICATSCW
jgi:hypothetical protein